MNRETSRIEVEHNEPTQESMSNRFWFVPKDKGGVIRRGYTMRAPYGLEIIESCFNCPHREERLFCNLSEPALKQLETITAAATYPKGATLFVEGQKPRGVFILCNGRVKLSTSSADGKTLILRVPEKGEILGLAASIGDANVMANLIALRIQEVIQPLTIG